MRTTLDEKTTEAEHVKKRASKAAKKFDEVIKEIAALNDEIEKLASERFAIYKKCKLEDIDLPLKKGKLDKVPLEEVSSTRWRSTGRWHRMLTLGARFVIRTFAIRWPWMSTKRMTARRGRSR